MTPVTSRPHDPSPPPPIALTCTQIAKLVSDQFGHRRTRQSVWRVIQRLALKPTVQAGRMSLYGPEAVQLVFENLRVLKRDQPTP